MNSESSMKPNIWPKLGSTARGLGSSPVAGGSLTPMMNSLSAPKWIAGLNGEICRIRAVPVILAVQQDGRNRKGMARLAIR